MGLEEPEKMFVVKPIRIGLRKPGKCRPLCHTVDPVEIKKKKKKKRRVLDAARTKVKNSKDQISKYVYFHPELRPKRKYLCFR